MSHEFVNLYRLTGESIANDPANNGNIGYIYDPVGNRNQRTSSITPILPQNFTGGYNPADLLKPTFSFDQNGNQTSDSQGRTYSYNTLNQLTQVTGTGVNVNYLYDGDGLRAQKVNNTTGVTTSYLWDRNNLTGYPQVTEEFQNSQLTRRYVYGPEGPLYMVQLVGGSWVTSYYGKDAQNIRFLMNDSGQITDSYTWDAFGNLISSSGAGTANNIGFDAEYRDSDTGLVYLRARWMNPAIGRFMEMDTDEGDKEDPSSLHKYQTVSNDPINRIDPSGNDDYNDMLSVMAWEPHLLWPIKLHTYAFHYAYRTTIIEWSDGFDEIRYGCIPWRDNNPGDITPGSFANANGSLGTDEIPDGTKRAFSIFPDALTGNNAMYNLLHTHDYQDKRLIKALGRWNESATLKYYITINSETGLGLFNYLNTFTDGQILCLMEAIKKNEGFYNPDPGEVTFRKW
jgi:RHS repeat-associated protein